jgi:hypothetical protein
MGLNNILRAYNEIREENENKREIKGIIKHLNIGKNNETCIQTIKNLERNRNKSAINPLVSLLLDNDIKVRKAAERALWIYGSYYYELVIQNLLSNSEIKGYIFNRLVGLIDYSKSITDDYAEQLIFNENITTDRINDLIRRIINDNVDIWKNGKDILVFIGFHSINPLIQCLCDNNLSYLQKERIIDILSSFDPDDNYINLLCKNLRNNRQMEVKFIILRIINNINGRKALNSLHGILRRATEGHTDDGLYRNVHEKYKEEIIKTIRKFQT